jgi:hypothetical protein
MLAGVLSLLIAFSGPVLDIPNRILEELARAQMSTMKSEREVFYCLQGKGTKVTGYTLPKQTHTRWEKQTGENPVKTVWTVDHDDCGKGTIADYHTHPKIRGGLKDCLPSPIDIIAYHDVTEYRYHAIGCYVWPRIKIAIYDWETYQSGEL